MLDGRVDAGIVYHSAAVAAGPDISIIRYPAPVNMSEKIRTDGYLAIPEGPGLAVRWDPRSWRALRPTLAYCLRAERAGTAGARAASWSTASNRNTTRYT
jgi:hypothetical protein